MNETGSTKLIADNWTRDSHLIDLIDPRSGQRDKCPQVDGFAQKPAVVESFYQPIFGNHTALSMGFYADK
jgi:hypothetical protein